MFDFENPNVVDANLEGFQSQLGVISELENDLIRDIDRLVRQDLDLGTLKAEYYEKIRPYLVSCGLVMPHGLNHPDSRLY